MSEENFAPPPLKGTVIKFKRKKKQDKLKKMLGDNLIGVTIRGDEIELRLEDGELSQSGREKIQRIVDGE